MEVDNQIVTLHPFFWRALLFFILGGYFLRLSQSGRKDWEKAIQPIQPTLKALDAPITTTLGGVRGLLQRVVCLILFWIFFVLAIDQLLLDGVVWANLVGVALGFSGAASAPF